MQPNNTQIRIIKLAVLKCGSQAKLAQYLQTNQIQISRYSTGKRELPLQHFLKILRLLGGRIDLKISKNSDSAQEVTA